MKKKIKARSPKKPTNVCSRFPIVGIGASAGGLESFTQLLQELPSTTGMAFVLIQHLDPSHSSLLSEALSKKTKMSVHEIEEGMRVKPNHVYVIPPGSDIAIVKGEFSLFTRDSSLRPHMAIDFFFRALAAECGNQAIGVVLSGNANDGTEGLRAIKTENGVTFAQDPKTAKYNSMPQSAVNAEVVDFCLAIPQLAKELVRLSKHPFINGYLGEPLSDPQDSVDLQKILVLLRTAAGVDFSEYKSPTIKRRLARRMALLKIDSLKHYIKILQNDPAEIKAVGADVLIHVTSFFRDPEVFKNLKTSIFPEMIKRKNSEIPIRIWVTGCSTGEEVYSIAISLLEFLGDRASKFSIQMFGSDISETMIEKARIGFYPDSSLREMDPERLQRFFVKVEGGYRISRLVRDLCVFVRHDLARDPPFSKLDLVTCRNVLIYFEAALQKRIIATFHYCLNQPGFLLLGRTESISGYHNLFSIVDKTNKIFAREGVTSQLKFAVMQNSSTPRPVRSTIVTLPSAPNDAAKQIDNLLLSRYAPAGVVVNERLEVIQYRGRTGLYLEPPPGQPQLNILKMVREGLFSAVKLALVLAKKKMSIVRKDGLYFTHNGSTRICNLVIIPITRVPQSKEALFLVLFEDGPTLLLGKQKRVKKVSKNVVEGTAKLRHELKTTQEYLESLNDEHQKTNDILNSMNEELVSGNEELQSMNEELETAKEELQSTNEELTTVNDELQNRNQETALVNDDLINLLNSVDIPIVILDLGRRIRRFTPKARSIMNLLPTDIGRQIDDIKPNIVIENLDQLIMEVIQKNEIQETEVKDRKGRWQRLQIRPYKTIDNKIAGAILSLINVDLLRKAVIDAEWIRDYANSIVDAIQIPLLVLDDEMNVVSANHVFYASFGGSEPSTEGKSLYELNDGRWNNESLKNSLKTILLKKTSFLNTYLSSDLNPNDPKVMSLSAHPIVSHNGRSMILLAIEDITERKTREKDRQMLLLQAQNAKEDADKANLAKDLFLATLSHELRTPLTSLILQAQLLRRGNLDDDKIKKASVSIERAAKVQTQLIEDLLDVSRIVTGKLKMELISVNLFEVIHAAFDTVSALAESKKVMIELHLDESVGNVSGDPIRLQQVVWNLLTNAIKFTPRGRMIYVHLKAVGEYAEIQVIDTGMGISPEFLPHVFNRFSQSESTNTRTYGGLGLGLAIVRHLIQMHNGKVKAESMGENKGTTFTVEIPLMKEIVDQTEFHELKLKLPSSKKSMHVKLDGQRVLIVEDDLGVREALCEMLSQAGAEVRAASSAADAMDVLKDFVPDQMVLDVAMPGENGYTLLRRIRALDISDGRIIPAIALTALASEKDRSDALSAGFQMHLVKPLDIDRLTSALLELHSLTAKTPIKSHTF